MPDNEREERLAYEARLQERLMLLKEYLEAGKVHFAEGLEVIESLKRVRYSPDGSVDLSTVDGLVRSTALAVEAMHDREELKRAIPLHEIQQTYFAFLERNFGDLYSRMNDKGLTPHDVAMSLTQTEDDVSEVVKNLQDFLNIIDEFWEQTGDAARAHVQDMDGTFRGIFGGDLFPRHDENIASKCGVYADTLVLPDPFLRTRHIFQFGKVEQHAYYLLKHALSLLKYKALACAEVDPPIVVILPGEADVEESEKEFFLELGKQDSLEHAARVFGRQFTSFEELSEFAETLDTFEKVEQAVVDPTRVLFESDLPIDLQTQISHALAGDMSEMLRLKHPGVIVASHALGRFGTSNELLVKARRLFGTPIVEAPTSWQYLIWKMEYDANRVEKRENLGDLHVMQGLGDLANTEMEWLGNVPPEALIELRATGAMDEIRQILARGIKELVALEPTNFRNTRDKVLDNINSAFEEHRNNIKELRARQWKFAGSDIGSWFVVGSLAIAAAATGTPVWALAALAAEEILDAPKLREIPDSIKKLARENKELHRSPTGMLFNQTKQK